MSLIPEKTEHMNEVGEQSRANCQETSAEAENPCFSQEELAACKIAQAERQYYKELFELAPDGYLVTDARGVIQEGNRAAANLLKVSQEFLVGKPLVIFVAESQRRLFQSKLSRRLRQSTPVQEWDVLLESGDGEAINATLRVTAIRDREDKPIALGWLLRDITDRKQVEAALRKRKRLIQQIADTTPNLIYIFDLNQNRNIYINRQAYVCLGYTPSEIQSMKSAFFTEVFHHECLPKLAEIKQRFLKAKDGEILQHELLLKNAKNEWRWLHTWDIVFTRNSDGTPQQILGTAIDITERKQAEEDSLLLEKDRECSQWQNRFFSMASHDFRTPLSTILASAQLLENAKEELPKEKMLRNIQRIQASAKMMTQLLDDILTINRAETGQLKVNRKITNLAKVCQEIVENIQLREGINHQINFYHQGECHQAFIDEKIVITILRNLLSNAIKYSPQGGSIYFALICEAPADGKLEKVNIFRIIDRGIGIPFKDRKHLFEPFYRGKNVGLIPGSGLGLTVVKKYVDLHSGNITVESEIGVGTTFTVTIPFLVTQ